ncbi:FAD binding domain protein [Xylariomycetidae sp. FL2044]|nr:FAD binding domain protein [Xylariomycetidae sp. FL2044]
MHVFSFSLHLLTSLLVWRTSALANSSKPTCRCIPGDECWPSSSAWSQLNTTVNGRLIAAAPLAQVCHFPSYNETACEALQDIWGLPQTHYPNPAEIDSPFWQNESCTPFTDPAKPCTLGNYVDYVINVSSAADVAAGLQFAQNNNIRLVIKSTGHDYLGKSTGLGALSLWTHNLKSIDFLDHSSPAYTGPAVKMGSGVQAFEVYEATASKGLRIVGGECSTVSLGGGYLQGGGHSLLSSTHGLGADQVLEWEVVTANGTHLTASPETNSDLYWALSGGGGGTYAVVLSVTVKAFEDGEIAGASLQINRADAPTDESFWEALEQLHALLPPMLDTGASVLYFLTNDSFMIGPVSAPGKSQQDVVNLLAPFDSAVKALNVPMVTNITLFPTYIEHFDHYLGPLPYGLPLVNIIDVSLAGRMVPRSTVEDPQLNAKFTEALKLSVNAYPGFKTGGIGVSVPHSVAGNRPSSNAVLPQWRETVVQILAFSPWDYEGAFQANVDAESYLVDVTVPALKEAAPNGGVYLNEANRRQTDWKESFYGVNYERLHSIKKAYDPEDLFYAVTAVGSDAWIPDSDGRLCRS